MMDKILWEPFWYNNQSHDSTLLSRLWARHGILQSMDVIGDDAEILQFAQFKQKYQVGVTIWVKSILVYNIPQIGKKKSNQLINHYLIMRLGLNNGLLRKE